MIRKHSLFSLANSTSPLPTLMVIPSGIGCSIGGYSGDGIPAARLLAAASGCLITHPNVMNGAALYWKDPRINYVEGYSLDRFVSGEIALSPVRQQKIGLLLDAGIESELRLRHLQVADGCRATLGLNVGPAVITDVPLEITLQEGSSGASWGDLGQPDSLLRAGEMLKDAGATAIAVVTRFPDNPCSEELQAYRHGIGVDAFAGAEAVISHLLVHKFCMPCAHAPAMAPLPIDSSLDPRVAGEELGHTFLACVLVGLSNAPNLVPITQVKNKDGLHSSEMLHVEDLGALVAPEGGLGGEAVLACLEKGIPLISVTNPGILQVTHESLGLIEGFQEKRGGLKFCRANNYLEAAGLLTLLREGIDWESLSRPLNGIDVIKSNPSGAS